MKVVGITGGIGSGKSEVIKLLQERWNVAVILADEVGHGLMKQGGKTYRVLVDYYGTQILNEDNSINKDCLRNIAFKNKESVEIINRLTHPLIKEEIINKIENIKKDTKENQCPPFIALESAILQEGGLDSLCDEIWYVYADEAIRIKRLISGRGYSKEHCKQIIEKQKSDKYYRQLANWTLDNSNTIEKTKNQLEKKIADMEKRSR